MNHSEESRDTKKWVAAGLLLVILYPLSFGPTCWLLMRTDHPGRWSHPTCPVARHLLDQVARDAYYPLVVLYMNCPAPVQQLFCACLDVGAPTGYQVVHYERGIVWHSPGWSHTFLAF